MHEASSLKQRSTKVISRSLPKVPRPTVEVRSLHAGRGQCRTTSLTARNHTDAWVSRRFFLYRMHPNEHTGRFRKHSDP